MSGILPGRKERTNGNRSDSRGYGIQRAASEQRVSDRQDKELKRADVDAGFQLLIAQAYLPADSIIEASGKTILVPGHGRVDMDRLYGVIASNPAGEWPWSQKERKQMTIG